MLNFQNIKKLHSKYSIDIVLIIILLAIGSKYVFDIQSFLDIKLKDETLYLNNGIYLLDLGIPNPQWAPAYSFWYFLLSLIEKDSIRLYYLNYILLTIILPVLLYCLLRTRGVNKLLAFLIGYFFLISSGNILINPKVTHFLMMIILGSMILFSLIKTANTQWYIIIYGAFLTSYIRPEFTISFILFLIFFLIKIIRTKFSLKGLTSIIFFIIPIFSLMIILGNPLCNGDRSFGAFCQHFSLNWVHWNHSKLNAWTDCQEIIRNNFGEVRTIYEAMIANRTLFLRHVMTNISSISDELSTLFSHTVFSVNSLRFRNTELLALIFILVFSTIINLFRSNLNIIKIFRDNLNSHKYIILISVTYLIPVLISVVIIYPRQHYLIVLFIMLFVFLVPLFNVPMVHSDRRKFVSSIILIGVGIFLLMITPHFTRFYTFKNQNNLETIKYIRELNIITHINVLEANGGYQTYLGKNFNNVAPHTKDIVFNKFLDQKKINMIIFSGKFGSLKNFYSDSSWSYFLNNYIKFDFRREIIPNSGNELFLKNYLMK